MNEVDPMKQFPVPVPDSDTEPFWEGVARDQLLVPRCVNCEAWIWQPRPVCPRCQSTDLQWVPVSGNGSVTSWTVLRPPVLPAYADMVPFVVLLVELDEGVRMIGYLVDAAANVLKTDGQQESLAMGSRVALQFHDQSGTKLPCWSLL